MISYDNSLANYSNAGSSISQSYTVGTGNDRLLVFGFILATGSSVSGTPTYNGVSMTQIDTTTLGGPTFNNIYLYYLLNPASGANTLAADQTGASYFYYSIGSYAGVKQASQPDASNKTVTASGTSLTSTLTTVADNCWHIGFYGFDNPFDTGASAGAGTTLRVTDGYWDGLIDSNAPKSPAGSSAIIINRVSTGIIGIISASFSPSGPTAMKTHNGLAKASIKKISGLDIESTKSKLGLE